MAQDKLEFQESGEHIMVYLDGESGAITWDHLLGQSDPIQAMRYNRWMVGLSSKLFKVRRNVGQIRRTFGLRRAS